MCSFLSHGLAGTEPKAGGWSWDELQELNAAVDWREWEAAVLPRVLREHGVSSGGGTAAAAAGAPLAAVPAAVDIPVHPSVAGDG